ncbi:hypothetical protein C2E23DRAFT_824148 [Lenzites betulinus]|nr:hypothetical protein C2E23DRAFT_824148 [Lenzites betulinus]
MFSWLQIFRLVAFGFALLGGILAVALGAHLASLTEKFFDNTLNFELLSIAVGAITLLTVPVMLVVDLLRTGAFTSVVLVELVWFSILWVLWVATGGLIADQTGEAFQTCDFPESPLLSQACNETRAIEAFAFLAFIALLAYTITLFVVAIVSHSRGVSIWMSSVKQHPSVVPSSTGASSAQIPMVQQPTGQYPGQQQAYSTVPTDSPKPQMPTPLYPNHQGVPGPIGSPAMSGVTYSSGATAGHHGDAGAAYPQV